jgi:hypothetical protein
MQNTASPLVNARKLRVKLTDEQRVTKQTNKTTITTLVNEQTKKERKPRSKLTDEQKKIMAEKRKATITAKKTLSSDNIVDLHAKSRKPRTKMTDEQKASMIEKRKLTMAINASKKTSDSEMVEISTLPQTPPSKNKTETPNAPKKASRDQNTSISATKAPIMVLNHVNKPKRGKKTEV